MPAFVLAAREPMTWGDLAIFAACAVAALLAVGLLLKLFVHQVGIPCQFCDARLKYWKELPPADHESILKYFQEYEKRTPETAGLFTCPGCGTVFDDFSGERLTRDYDAFGIRAWCRICNNMMWNKKDLGTWDGVSESPYMKCHVCGAVHQWKTFGTTRFRFLMPPEDQPVLPRNREVDLHPVAVGAPPGGRRAPSHRRPVQGIRLEGPREQVQGGDKLGFRENVDVEPVQCIRCPARHDRQGSPSKCPQGDHRGVKKTHSGATKPSKAAPSV